MTVLQHLQALLTHIEDSDAAPTESPLSLLPITDSAATLSDIKPILQSLLSEGQQHQRSDWAAHMTSPVMSAALMGQIMAALHNGNLLSPELYPVLEQIEQDTLSWLGQLFEQPNGHTTAGGSYGNLEALWQAKQISSRRHVYASSSTHYSITKACQLLDLTLIQIPCNHKEQIELDALNKACQQQAPLAIIANAGTSAMGAFDPIEACIAIAQQYQAWCHIDAAWGGGLKLLPEYRDHFGPCLSQAHSLCFDPHKTWGQPKPSSFLFYRQLTTPLFDAHYLQQQPKGQLQGSRGGEACLPLWLTLQLMGVSGLTQWSRESIQQSHTLAQQLQQYSHWHVYTPQSGIVCFHCQADLSPLVQQGVISVVQHHEGPLYRCVFIGSTVSPDAVFTQLQPYF